MGDVHLVTREKFLKGQRDVTTETIGVMLVKSTYVSDPTIDTLDDGTVDDPASHEISSGSYSRATLTGKVVQRSDGANEIRFKAGSVDFGVLEDVGETIGGVVAFFTGASDAAREIFFFDDAADLQANGVDPVVYVPNANGIALF